MSNMRNPYETTAAMDYNPAFVATEDQESDPLHPDSKRLFHVMPWIRSVPIFGEACQAYGPKCTVSLALCYLLCKGVADQGIQAATYAMFVVRYGLDATRYQRLAQITKMGWSIKALTAMLCDGFAFMGYTKRWYMMVSCFAGGAFALGFGLLPGKLSSANPAALFVFLTAFGKANVDILSEGHYSRLMRKIPKAGPALVSWVWIFIMMGALVASIIQGPLSDAGLQEVGVYVAAALQFLTGFIFVFNWYGEKTNREERAEDAYVMHKAAMKREAIAAAADNNSTEPVDGEDIKPNPLHGNPEVITGEIHDGMDEGSNSKEIVATCDAGKENEAFEFQEPIPCCCGVFEFNKEVSARNWRVFVYSIVMTIGVIAMTCTTIFAGKLVLMIVLAIVSVVCCGMSFWALPPVIARAIVFGYVEKMTYLQMPGPLDTFYQEGPDCNPGGPNFSFTFYNTVTGIISSIAGLGGVACFNYIFYKRSYQLTIVVTTIIYAIASVFDIVMVKRWNLKIGIPDHAMYISGDAIMSQVCYMLNWMPSVVLLSRLCPRGSESVVYSLMAGFSNLGQSASGQIGALLMEYVWPVDTDSKPCNFSNVAILTLIGHCILPLVNIPLSYVLLPHVRICDNVDVDGRLIASGTADDMVPPSTGDVAPVKRETPASEEDANIKK